MTEVGRDLAAIWPCHTTYGIPGSGHLVIPVAVDLAVDLSMF